MSIISHDPAAHRFVTEVDGNSAHLDYTLANGTMTITHTRVPPPISGRGVAAELMAAALGAAQAAGWTVVPACSYAKAYMARHAGAAVDRSQQKHLDDLLDEALEESFPASDSPSVGGAN